jgi:outer membrane protein TolC
MNILRLFLAASLLVLGLGAQAAEADVNRLVLPEKIFPELDAILRGAVQQSPRMLRGAMDLEIAEETRIQARANLLPSVGGSVSYYQSRDTRSDMTDPVDLTKIYYNFSVSQPVFYWGERRNYARVGEIQASIMKGQYREAYRLLAQTLRQDYLRLIVQKTAVKRADFYLQHLKKQLAQEEERLAKKVISEYQISAVRLAAEQAQIASEKVQFDFMVAKASFARMSGSELLSDMSIPDTIPTATYDAATIDRLLAAFLGQQEVPSNDAQILRKVIQTEKLSYSSLKKRLYPKFSFVIGASQDDQSYTINIAQKYAVKSVYGGLSASWAIFDGFTSQSLVRVSLARQRQLDNDYRELTDRLAKQAQNQVKQLNFAARSMAISDQAWVSGETAVKAKQEEFSRGVSSEADIRIARLNLYDAQLNALSGRIEYLTRIVDFLATLAEDPVLGNLPATK